MIFLVFFIECLFCVSQQQAALVSRCCTIHCYQRSAQRREKRTTVIDSSHRIHISIPSATYLQIDGSKCLRALSTDAASELDVLGHDGDPLGVDGAQVGVLEEANKVSLGGLLKGKDGRSLEPQVGLEILGDLTDQPLERELADQELGTLLVPADLAKGDGSGAVPVRFLDSSGGGGRLPGGLGSELLPGGLSSGTLACGLFSASHFE
jgi:hypothetical protein